MDSRFLYQAYGVGVSGYFTRPVNQLISSQAVSALAPAGGYSDARQEPYRLLELFSHEGATSSATGERKPLSDNHQTLVTATIKGLNIENVVLLESCTARLSGVHPGSGEQANITPLGSFFGNLKIAGHKIELESRVDLYNELDTLDKLSERYKADSSFRMRFLNEAFVDNEDALHEKQWKYFPWRKVKNTAELPVSRAMGKTIVPLFIVKNPSSPGFHVSGNAITVENFGTVVLGELVISGYERRITMLHAEMGSPAEGACSACVVGGNGGGTDP
jgi:hypothetical protein